MAIIETVLDGGKDILKIIQEIKSCKVLSKAIRVIAAFLVLLTWGLHYWNIFDMELLSLPRFEQIVRETLANSLLVVVGVWLFYCVGGRKFLWGCTNCFNRKEKEKIFPICFTIDDCIEFGFSVYFFICGTNILVEFLNGYAFQLYETAYRLAFIYLFCIYVQWVYKKNSRSWSQFTKKYTGFYDNEGNPIPEDGYVIYYGELYEVYLGNGSGGVDRAREWKISSNNNRFKDEISLAVAVKDKEGRLMLEKHSL